jgi:PKD repeat protein
MSPGVILQTWKQDMNMDWHSILLDPGFDTATFIPHYYAARIGVPLPQVRTDFYGKTRSLIRTTAGACEMREPGTCLSGTYTIGGKGADYATFTAAATDLLLRGVCGRTVFNVADGTYKESIKLHPFPGLSAENRVVFQSASGDSSKVIITDSNPTGHTIRFDSANYISFRKMTISSSDTSTIYLYRSSGDSISSNLLLQKSKNTGYYSIYELSGDSDLTIAGNHIIGGYYGIGAEGNNVVNPGSGWVDFNNKRLDILNNTFDSISNTAGYLLSQFDMHINGNRIGVTHPAKFSGFYLEGNRGKTTFSRNMINTNSGYPLNLTYNSDVLVSNNMISGKACGIYVEDNYDVKYYSNNIISQNYGIFIYQYETGAELKNNNIVMTTGNGWPLWLYDKTVLDTSDYNNYYAKGNNIGFIYKTGDSIKNISDMQAKLGKNDSSRSEDPKYISSLNLHIQDTALIGKGIGLPIVTDDFDGNKRPYKPTIGAHELNPINDFNWTFTNACLPNVSVRYRIIKTNPLIKTYKWELGDGKGFVAGADTISHTYTAAGTYHVQVKMYLASGTEIGTVTHNVTIYNLPKAFMISDTVACLNSPIIFFDSSFSGSGSLKYVWSFGDGKTDSAQNTAHAYSKAGVYTVSLTVTSKQGCSSTTSKNIRIAALPVLAFHVQSAACAGTSVLFNDSTAMLNKGSLNYKWTMGDGGFSMQYSPAYIYAKAGTYTVSLTATSILGCTASLSKIITIGALPVLSYTAPNNACAGATVTFSDSTALLNKGTLTYKWSFGDGGVSSNYSPSYVYLKPGTDTISLTAVSSLGCTASLKKAISIEGLPIVVFSIPKTSCAGTILKFDDSTALWNKGALSYKWEMGNGDTSAVYSPVYTYVKAGTDTVRLTATSKLGCTNSLIKTITIGTVPVIAFGAPSEICVGSTITFNDSTALLNKGTLSYKWSLGEGDSSTQYSPSHTYVKQGTDTVNLVATSSLGCSASLKKSLVVDALPVLAFGAPKEACLGTNVKFEDSSALLNNGTLTYYWIFGDGDSSRLYSPVHSYNNPGNYTIALAATSAIGCTGTLQKSIIINALPVASFIYSANYRVLTFIPADLNLSNYSWDFGDGTNSTLVKPTHTYAKDSSYTVSLKVTNGKGCTAANTRVIKVSGPSALNPDIIDLTPTLNIFPNPSQVAFNISYEVMAAGHVTLTIEDLLGGTVTKITDANRQPGQFVATFKPGESGLSPGVYFVKLRIGNTEVAKRIVYLR